MGDRRLIVFPDEKIQEKQCAVLDVDTAFPELKRYCVLICYYPGGELAYMLVDAQHASERATELLNDCHTVMQFVPEKIYKRGEKT